MTMDASISNIKLNLSQNKNKKSIRYTHVQNCQSTNLFLQTLMIEFPGNLKVDFNFQKSI